MGVVDCSLLFCPETDLHTPTRRYKMISAMRRPTWLHVQEDVGAAGTVNSETLLGPTQRKGIVRASEGAKLDHHHGSMFHTLEPVQIECANVNFPTMGIHG